MEPTTGVEVLREAEPYFNCADGRVVGAGIEQVRVGKLHLTNIDTPAPIDFLISRHTQRAEHRQLSRFAVGGAVVTLSVLSTFASVTLIGGTAGIAVGSFLSIAGHFALNRLQRQRKFSITLPSGAQIVLSRADASRVSLTISPKPWTLRVPSGAAEMCLGDADAYAVLARVIPLFRKPSGPSLVSGAVALVRSMDEVTFMQSVAGKLEGNPDRPANTFLTNPRSIWAASDEELIAIEILATEQRERLLVQQELSALNDPMHEALSIAQTIDNELS
jgi:hypothetical protein